MRRLIAAAAGLGVAALFGKALTTRKDIWALTHGRDGFQVRLGNAPTWAIWLEDAMELLPCTCNHEWLYEIGFGKTDPGLGTPEHNLGSLGFRFCAMRAGIVWRREKHVCAIPVTVEQARAISPDWVTELEEIFDGELEPNPHSTGPDSFTQSF